MLPGRLGRSLAPVLHGGAHLQGGDQRPSQSREEPRFRDAAREGRHRRPFPQRHWAPAQRRAPRDPDIRVHAFLDEQDVHALHRHERRIALPARAARPRGRGATQEEPRGGNPAHRRMAPRHGAARSHVRRGDVPHGGRGNLARARGGPRAFLRDSRSSRATTRRTGSASCRTRRSPRSPSRRCRSTDPTSTDDRSGMRC